MSKYVKGSLIFVGGFVSGAVIGGVSLLNCLLNDEDIRTGVKHSISNKIDKCLYGETYSRRNYFKNNKTVSYHKYYDTAYVQNEFTPKDILFESRETAEKVLSDMRDVVNNYGFITVSDFYDVAGLNKEYYSHLNNRYGWTELSDDITVKHYSNVDYYIDLPKPARIRI